MYEVDSGGVEWKLIQVVEELDNPSFLAFDRKQEMLFDRAGRFIVVSDKGIDPESGRLTPFRVRLSLPDTL